MLHQLLMQLLVHLSRHQIQEPLEFEKKTTDIGLQTTQKLLNPVKCMHVNGQLTLERLSMTLTADGKRQR